MVGGAPRSACPTSCGATGVLIRNGARLGLKLDDRVTEIISTIALSWALTMMTLDLSSVAASPPSPDAGGADAVLRAVCHRLFSGCSRVATESGHHVGSLLRLRPGRYRHAIMAYRPDARCTARAGRSSRELPVTGAFWSTS